MDRVRDLVAAGGVSVVLAQDRDRFSREPAYSYLLKREFEEHGCILRSLNDMGDGSPEGDLTDGILDQLAKYERAKIAERSRRGKLRKAREGRAVAPIAKYGYRFNDARDALVVHDPEMAVVERIFRMAAEGCGVGKIQSALYAKGIPSPRGRDVWDRRVLRKIVASDDYRPLSFREISELVAPEVAARLDESKCYGVQWYNRDKAISRTTSESDGNGGRLYKKRKTLQRRPREEWLAIPVPATLRLPRDLVDQARATMNANVGSERKRLARAWELRGVMRCSCGSKMQTRTTMPEGRGPYHYYLCARRVELRKMCSCTQKAIRALEAEESIWVFVSRLLKDPETIRRGMERLVEQERAAASRGNPESTAKAWADKVAECARLRAAYQDQQAVGLMTLEELGEKLSQLDEIRRHAEKELSTLRDYQERVEQLEADRDALLEAMSETVPHALDDLSGEERNKVYRMLRLEVTPTPEGYTVTGALRARLQNDTDALIKYALVDFSPVEVAFFQAGIGAVGLLAIVLFQGGRARAMLLDILRRPLPALVLGALAIAAPFILISTGELSIPSGLAGVLLSSTPMFVAFFAPFLDRSVEINRIQALGLMVGLVGVALVVGVQAVSSLGQLLGALAVLGAAASGAISSFVVKLQYRDKNVPPTTTTFFSLSVGAVLVAPFAFITASGDAPGARAIIAVIVLGLACTAVTFLLYYLLIAEVGEERAALGNYLTPIFALFYGVILLGEHLTIDEVVGLALIIVGAEITLRGDSAKRAGGEAKAHEYRPHPPFH